MEELQEQQGQVLYVIYQPIPHRERVYMWINGGEQRESTKMESLKKWVEDSEQEFLIPSFMKTFTTYSFYLWNKVDKKVFYLQPNIHSNDFKKPLTQEIKNIEKQAQKEEEKLKDPMKKVFDQFTMVDLEDAKKITKM